MGNGNPKNKLGFIFWDDNLPPIDDVPGLNSLIV